jgi:hypothetical protein
MTITSYFSAMTVLLDSCSLSFAPGQKPREKTALVLASLTRRRAASDLRGAAGGAFAIGSVQEKP